MPFLHYAVQIPPERVMLAEYDEDYYLSLGIGLEVADLRGERIDGGGDTLEEHFDAQRAQALIRSPLAFYDRLALVPGVYDISVEVVNRVNDEGALARSRMSVTDAPRDDVVLGDLLVAGAVRRVDRSTDRAFQFEGFQFVPAVSGRVNAGGELHLFAQLIAGFAAQPGDAIDVTGYLLDAEGNEVEAVSAVPVTPRPAPTPTPLNVSIPLTGMRPGPYTARLTARLPGDRMLSREKAIEVVVADSEVDPIVLLAGEPPQSDARDFQARGSQHLRKGETAAAVAYFRAGLDQDPNAVGLRRLLAQVLNEAGEHAEAARVISPLARSQSATSGDALLLSIALREAGEPAGAAQTARVLLQRWTPTAPAYNALGDALLALGDQTEAAQAFRDSLALDPEQPEVRAKLERISRGIR
jgi:tetratricopeptide (TPR) repeat protein